MKSFKQFLIETNIDSILNAIKMRWGNDVELYVSNRLSYVYSIVPIKSRDITTMSKIADFLEKHSFKHQEYEAGLFYLMISPTRREHFNLHMKRSDFIVQTSHWTKWKEI